MTLMPERLAFSLTASTTVAYVSFYPRVAPVHIIASTAEVATGSHTIHPTSVKTKPCIT
jgi:hypothetical protein